MRSSRRTRRSSPRWARRRSGGNTTRAADAKAWSRKVGTGFRTGPCSTQASSGWHRELRLLRLLRQPLVIERNEIHRIEQERRIAPVAHRGRDDLAREREQEPRALDHDHRLDVLLRDIHNAEHTGEGQIEDKQHHALGLGFAFELERHFVVGRRELVDAHIDLNVELRLLLAGRERARRIRILKREILDVLPEHVELRKLGLVPCGWLRRRTAIVVLERHSSPPPPKATRSQLFVAWLTQRL